MTTDYENKAVLGMSDDDLLSHPLSFREDLMKDQVVLVSGGGTGIGKAIAVVCARLGADVVICGRKEENLVNTKPVVEKAGGSCTTKAMTIRDADEVADLMEMVWDTHGRLDLLVNNAGGQFPQDAIDFTPKGWHAVIETNLTGSFYMMQAAARKWRAAKQPGSIVNIIANFWRGMPQIAHTSAARAGVANLAHSLGVEWAPYQIRVNCVAPGTIETEGLNVYPAEARAIFHDRNCMRRLGTVVEVAESVVYMGGPPGSFITGQTLTVDGGQFMWGDGWPFGQPDYFS